MSAALTIQLLLFVLFPLVASAAGQSDRTAPPGTNPEATPQAQEERATASAQPSPEKRAGRVSEPAKQKETAPKRVPPRRRSVQQVIDSVVPPPPATQTYGPVLNPPGSPYRTPSSTASPPVAGAPPLIPPPPSQLNTCTGSFCTDAAGTTYNSGVGSAAVNSQGRLCNKVGNTIQCF